MLIIIEEFCLLVIGLVAGIIGSIVGLGGGFIIVPALLFFAQFSHKLSSVTPPIAVGSSLVLIMLTALASTRSYAKKELIDYKSGWLFFLASGPGAILGSYLTEMINLFYFYVAFGLVMVLISLLFAIEPKIRSTPSEVRDLSAERLLIFTVSFVIGLLSGTFGIGGGALFIPVMVMWLHFPFSVATATSMFVILLTAMLSSVVHFIQGNVDSYAVILLAPGAWLGGKIGAWIALRLKDKWLGVLFRFILILIGIRMIIKGFQV